MIKNISPKRLTGEMVSQLYQSHAQSPHGRLRHDLLFLYYRFIIRKFKIKFVFDLGAGTGILAGNLLTEFPNLSLVLVDDDAAMVEVAKEKLNKFLNSSKRYVEVIKAGSSEMPKIISNLRPKKTQIMLSFNHAIEYIKNKNQTISLLADSLLNNSIFGIMYLNNSHEVFRKIYFKDSIESAKGQLNNYLLDMVHFGGAKAIDSRMIDSILQEKKFMPLAEFGIRCVSDFKSKEFVESNYPELLKIEFDLGKLSDFWGLARYRLKYFKK